MDSLTDSVKQFCQTQGFDQTYWVAFSGGLDSTVLLTILIALRKIFPLKLKAVHLHHGLSDHADAWRSHCEKFCAERAVDFQSHRIHVNKAFGDSLENSAREARYAVLASCLAEGDILLTAHHQDDQAETVLLQLCRGSGPKGLSAMPPIKNFAKGFHARPLLNFSREDLKHYAEHYSLSWIEDESNTQLKFTRNFIRHEVMPLLKSRWPTVAQMFSRSAMHCAALQDWMSQEAHAFLQKITVISHGYLALMIEPLLQLNAFQQSEVLRQWMLQQKIALPSTIKMQHILQDVLLAAKDKSPCLTWGDIMLRRYRDRLYLMPNRAPAIEQDRLTWDFKQPLILNDHKKLQATLTMGMGLRRDIENVSVRFRQGGERIQLAGHPKHRELKNLFQEWGVLPWERNQVPLIFVGETLAAVIPYGIAESFKAATHQPGWQIDYILG